MGRVTEYDRSNAALYFRRPIFVRADPVNIEFLQTKMRIRIFWCADADSSSNLPYSPLLSFAHSLYARG
jgi:hypothetical protein